MASNCGDRDNVVCTYFVDGRVCGGDSGGALVADMDSDGRWVLYGVTSFISIPCERTDGYEGFADVAHWADTIISQVQANP